MSNASPAQDDRTFRVITQPKTEWWIRIGLERVPIGWVVIDEKAIKQGGRSF